MNKQQSKSLAAAKSGMDEKTARKYVKEGKLPSQLKKARNYRTRKDPFDSVWGECQPLLEQNPGLEAQQLFYHLQREYPGRFPDGQLRTFQRETWGQAGMPCPQGLPGSDTILSIACHCLRSRGSDYKLTITACNHAAFQGAQPVGLLNATISELIAFTFVAACYFSSMGSIQFVTSLYAI